MTELRIPKLIRNPGKGKGIRPARRGDKKINWTKKEKVIVGLFGKPKPHVPEKTCGDCKWWNSQRMGCCMNPTRGRYSDLPDNLKPCKHFKEG